MRAGLRIGACVVAGLLAAIATPAHAREPAWVARVDLEGRGVPVEVTFYRDDAGSRGFLHVGGRPGWTSPVYRAWKAAAGDLDGDGRVEVILGTWVSRHRHDEPDPHRSIWVFGWDGDRLRPLWRGSALGMPLVDFEVAERDGRAVLRATERGHAGTRLTVYRWTGFGFAEVRGWR